MHQIFVDIPETHRNISDHLGGVDTPMGRAPAPKNPGQVEQIHGVAERSISQLLLGPHAPNIFCRFLRHTETFLDHLGGVDTPAGRVWAPKTGLRWANTWGRGRSNTSASIRAPCTKYFLEVPDTHRNISRLLERCWITCWQSASAQKPGQVDQIHGGRWGGEYLSFY